MNIKRIFKIFIFIFVLFLVGTNVAVASEFCDGFKAGYVTAYRSM